MSKSNDKPNMVKETNTRDITGKALLACFIAAVLIICVQAAGTYMNLQSFLRRETSYPSLEAGIKGSIEELSASIDSHYEMDKKKALTDTYFRALALRDKMNRSDFLDSTVEDYGKSYVVRVRDGKLTVPDEAQNLPGITADDIKGEQGIIDTSRDTDWRCFTAYSAIGNGYYAMQEVNASDGADNMASIALYEIETAFDGKAILLDENGRFVYYSFDLKIPELRNENGLDEEALDKFLKKHAPYYVMARSADERYTLILLLSKYEILIDSLSIDLLVALVALILSVVLIVWISEIKRLLKSGKADKKKLGDYEPLHIKNKIRTFCILAVVIVFLAGLFSSAVGSLYSVTWDAQNTLSAVQSMDEDLRSVTEFRISEMKENDAEHAKIIADALYRNPDLRTKKQLGVYKDMLSANYIMLYDSEGREFLTDSPYINMNIGGLSSSDMRAFRRVLNGGSEAYLENVTDNVTGAKSNLVGVRMPDITGDNGSGYNLLVISYPPSSEKGVTFLATPDDMASSLVSSYNGYLLLDKDKKIRFLSNKSLYGRDPLELGMKEDEIRDNFLGEFYLDNDHYYGASNEMNGELFYYITKASVMREGMFTFGLLEAVGFLLVLLIILRILMKDYDLIYDKSTAGEYDDQDSESSREWASRFPWIKRASSPEARARVALNIMAGLCIFVIGVLAITSAGADKRDSLIPYIFSDSWNRGLNLFAIARVAFMICGVAVIWSIVAFIVGIAVAFLDTRGASVVRLIKSVLSYAVVLIVLYYSALYLGFDPATLLASVGIIGLAISLGVKDIVADVFSGVSLIFEKAFQVGDIVEIDGLVRGTVQELGVRTLKLFGDDNNLKVIRYSDIHKVNNLSRSNSWCIAEFTVKNNVNTEELKKMLWAELPEIRERHKEILSDPVFTGISTINIGSITFGVRAECKETKMRKVRSILNYEIRDMLNRNGIEML